MFLSGPNIWPKVLSYWSPCVVYHLWNNLANVFFFYPNWWVCTSLLLGGRLTLVAAFTGEVNLDYWEAWTFLHQYTHWASHCGSEHLWVCVQDQRGDLWTHSTHLCSYYSIQGRLYWMLCWLLLSCLTPNYIRSYILEAFTLYQSTKEHSTTMMFLARDALQEIEEAPKIWDRDTWHDMVNPISFTTTWRRRRRRLAYFGGCLHSLEIDDDVSSVYLPCMQTLPKKETFNLLANSLTLNQLGKHKNHWFHWCVLPVYKTNSTSTNVVLLYYITLQHWYCKPLILQKLKLLTFLWFLFLNG